ncbi:MAG: D-aminoacylase, partial [Firmicutes bacterium]|nr:D-aminoacylase [Bacillota bacterium]
MDLIIKNATIVDGTGAEPFEGSIPIRDGKIRAIWHGGFPAGVEAKEIYDAKGLVVSPGFIDIHCHSDETFYKYPKEEGKILQGVTT